MTDSARPKRTGKAKAAPVNELTPVSEVGGLTSNPTPDDRSLPREPETEKARSLREQYLACARVVLADQTLSYPSLYQRYASDQAEVQQAAQSLDQAVAQLALQSGQTPRGVTQLLAQGPFTQFQTRDLYREHIGSDLVAIQLDQKVAAAALKGGETATAIAVLLQQSPYARFQREVKQVQPEVIEHYDRGTVAQVQEIQSLSPGPIERSGRVAAGESQGSSGQESQRRVRGRDR